MAIGFIIGRAGTGKTHHCLVEITRALQAQPLGPPIYWIVPRQATFSTERLLLDSFGPFSRCRIVSFDQLGVEVLGATGGAAATRISARGRQMILGLLLRQHRDQLTFFGPSARRVGLSRELDRTFAEIERSGRTLEEMVETLEKALDADPTDADTDTLLTKSRELTLLYNAYRNFLGPDRLDEHGQLLQVLKSMSACPTFGDSTVFIDGFNQFTRHERQMVVGLAKSCRDVTVTMLMDPASPLLKSIDRMPDEMALFHKIERSYRQLLFDLKEAGIAPAGPIVLKDIRRCTTAALKRIEQASFAGKTGQPTPADASIERIEAPDRAAEVDAVARKVRSLQMRGVRLGDILVLVRDLSDYESLLATSFGEHGIAYFVDARRSAMHHPLLQWVRSVFAIARRDWPHDEVMALLKTSLCGVSLDDADEVENYVLFHGLMNAAWEAAEPWELVRKFPADDEDAPGFDIEPARVDQIRQTLLSKIGPFLNVLRNQPRLTFRQICTELFKLFDAFDVRTTVAQWIAKAAAAGELETAAQHEQVWANLVELFDEMVDLLGDHEISLEDFVPTLEAGLESFDFALAPPTLDQVSVGEIDRARVSNARAAIVLGLAEGMFPKLATEPSVLTDNDRTLLRRRSIELDDDLSRQLLDERLLGYIAFTRASDCLILTRPASDDADKPLEPSPFWRRFDGLFDGIPTHGTPCYAHDKPDCIATPRQFVTGLMKWARRQSDPKFTGDPTWPVLYQAMAEHPVMVQFARPSQNTGRSLAVSHGSGQVSGEPQAAGRANESNCTTTEYPTGMDAIATIRRQAWRALSYVNNAELSPAIAGELFPSPLNAGVAQIETFAACPFKHFARYGLQLQSREVRDFTFADVGMAYHRILENIVREMLQSKQAWRDLTEEEAAARIKSTAEAVAKELRQEIMLSTARNRYLLDRIQRTLTQVVASQRALAERQTTKPARVGVGFGRAKDLLQPPLIQTPSGKQVRLHGRIDRVDIVEGQKLLTIIDYKSGGGELRFEEVFHGLAMQLLAYMLVIRENAREPRLTPIAAFYHKVTRTLTTVAHPDDAADPASEEFLLREKPRGIFDQRYLEHFDRKLAGGASAAVNVFVTRDNQFGKRETSDNADPDEIKRLLDHVKETIAVLADDLMSGTVAVKPYKLGNITPCPRCDYRNVCRFEAGINQYNKLTPKKRSEVLEELLAQPGGGGDA